MKPEHVVMQWQHLKEAFKDSFKEAVEEEWGLPFSQVYSFLTSRSRRQLTYIAMAGKATELLCFHISQLTREPNFKSRKNK